MGTKDVQICTDTKGDFDRDFLRNGWTFDKEDILCLPVMKDNAQTEEYRTIRTLLTRYSNINKRKTYSDGQLSSKVFEILIHQMRDKIEDKGLVPHDVYPDGNCMFAAIVDQLRVQGDFSFTSQSLRPAAVTYLRRNPVTDDGTPLSMFLTDGDTWESYLLRISEDGEWGDHIILGALANVICKHIVILGGATGERETVLNPRSKTGRRDISASEHVALDENNTIYLGHVSESHYISLRPMDWKRNLLDGLHKKGLTRETATKHNLLIPFPVNYMNIILRYMFKNGCLLSYLLPEADILTSMNSENSECRSEAFGSLTCKMIPFNSLDTGTKSDRRKDLNTPEVIMTIFETPKDTDIVTSMNNSKSVDLISVRTKQMSFGHLKLSPCEPRLWRGQTTTISNIESTFIKTNDTYHNLKPGYLSSKPKREKTDLQFVLAFRCSWPEDAKEWANRRRTFGFPDEQTVKAIVHKGCHVIPLTSCVKMLYICDDPVHLMTSIDDHTWSYSFAAAEKELSRSLSSEQKQCFLLFQALVDIALKGLLAFPSMLKSVFYYACENIAVSSWKSDPVGCIYFLLKNLSFCLKNRHIPHFFMPEKNIIDHVPGEITDECFQKLECSRMQPLVSIYILLEQYTFLLSKQCISVDEIVEVFCKNEMCDPNISSSLRNTIQVNPVLCEDLVYQGNYSLACAVMQDMVEEKGKSLNEDGGVKMAVNTLNEIPIQLSWCFTLFIDIIHKTNLTTELCQAHPCIPLSDMFGPDCIGDLPNTNVPYRFSICNGDLQFAKDVSDVLIQVVTTTTYIKCMKFYLKEYGILAGDSLVLTNLESCIATCDLSSKRQIAFKSTHSLSFLHGLYVTLYNICNRCQRVEEYREMMPMFTLIAKSLGTDKAIRNIRIMNDALEHSEIFFRSK